MSTVRRIAATVAGMFAGTLVILVVELVGQSVFPLPLAVDTSDPERLAAALAEAPALALGFVLLAWAAGAAVGAGLARWLGRSPVPAVTVVVLLLLASVYNMIRLPHPWWFWVVGIAVFPVFGMLGSRWAGRRAQSSPGAGIAAG